MPTPTHSKPRRLFRDRDRAHKASVTLPAAPDPIDRAAVLIGQADAALREGREHEAAEILERALRLDPRSFQGRFKLATIRVNRPRDVADLEAALRLARELLAERPALTVVHFLAALACQALGIDCRRHLAAALEGTPQTDENHARVRLFEAVLQLEAGDFSAMPSYAHWFDRFPDRQGRLVLMTPRWDGRPLTGRRIMIHGMIDRHGDAFQFVRYAPMIKAMGGRATLVCHPSQVRLFQASERYLQIADGTPEGTLDVQAPFQSLPALFRTTLDTIPAVVPYLCADPETIERWRPAVEAIPAFRIGVAFQGDPTHGRDVFRSFRLDELARLAEVPGVSLANLQKGHGAEHLAAARFPIHDLGAAYQAGDWLDTAAVVSQVDLVVSLDSAIAHLAGALGKPVWLALPTPGEWRWMRDRDDSPWYPTMRLFRQDKLGEWGPVFGRMAEALGSIAARP